jgi:hypothetical protein
VTAQDPAAAAARELGPDAQLDLLDRELARRRAEREAEAKRADSHGGPCRYCGTVVSWQAPGVGGWLQLQGSPVCHGCAADRGGLAGDDRTDRIRAARLVLGDTPAPAWAGHGDSPAARWWHDDYLATAMVWWYEVPGARPGRGAERFGYLTGLQLVARLYQGREPRPPTLYSRGRRMRCPGCGCKGECWQVEQVGVSGAITSTGELSRVARAHFRVTWTCSRCRHVEVEQRAEQVADVPVAGLIG